MPSDKITPEAAASEAAPVSAAAPALPGAAAGRPAASGESARNALFDSSAQQLEDLLAHARQVGTRSGDLDEIVHEVVSWRAAEINNGGLEAQLRCLFEAIGPAQTRELLPAGTEGNEEPSTWQDTGIRGEIP